MITNYTSGGQVFLHKARMFAQVFSKTMFVSVIIGCCASGFLSYPDFKKLDLRSVFTYQKARLARSFDFAIGDFRDMISSNPDRPRYVSLITVPSYNGEVRKVTPSAILKSSFYRNQNKRFELVLVKAAWVFAIASAIGFVSFVLIWYKFGKSIKSDSKISGGAILTAQEVSKNLRANKQNSKFHIGKMPLVKDQETRHFLVTGATGSGKTNLLHTMLPQVKDQNMAAIVVDQTGEMIAKYYDPTRGDIIFNPLDDRSHVWDFWSDMEGNEHLEKFAKILFGFNRKSHNFSSDPFWEQSAETVFVSCVEYLRHKSKSKNSSVPIALLKDMLQTWDQNKLEKALKGTKAARYLTGAHKTTSGSILSVLTNSTKPLDYLRDANENDQTFSLKGYFESQMSSSEGKDNTKAKENPAAKDNNESKENTKDQRKPWLFLATKPNARELTLPLLSCILELSISYLVEQALKQPKNKNTDKDASTGNITGNINCWFVLDELAALGRLPTLEYIMSEGRKYGAAILAATQSLNQLYSIYGQQSGSTIFGQFGTKFFFRNDEPTINTNSLSKEQYN